MTSLAVLGCRGGTAVPENPTFVADVAPILQEHCVACHQPNGHAPFALTTYEDARGRASLIATATRSRRMPPWLPRQGNHRFVGERILSDRELTILERWAAQEAPKGVGEASITLPTAAHEWPLGKPDLIVEMTESYTLADTGRDVFRNFALPIPVESLRYVRAVDLQPGDHRVVHHVVMSVDSTDISRQEDARDDEPGYDGMFSRSAARPPSGFYLGWTPGRAPKAQPEGMAWPLVPGTDLVLQMHMRPDSEPTQLRPRVGIYFASTPPKETPVLIRLGGQTIDIPPGKADYTVTDSVRLPVGVELLGLYPHAHYLARVMQITAIEPGGTEHNVLRINDWDFNWQDAYDYQHPLPLPAGTVLHLRYTYDNSASNPRNPQQPPQRVVYGPNTTDEMAEVWIQALPRKPSDLAALRQELTRKSLHDRLQGAQHLVTVNPNDANAHAYLGAYYNSAGNATRAIEHYHEAIRAQPDFASAHYNLGIVFEARDARDSAAHHYRQAIRYRPNHPGQHNNLGNVLLARGQRAEAMSHFRRAIELDPKNVEAHNNLGRALWAAGSRDEAIAAYRNAVALQPTAAPARFNLALSLAALGRTTEALNQFAQASNADPRALEASLAMAWLLATHQDARVRRPEQAVSLAAHAARLAGAPHPRILDVQAAAEAAAGRFNRAARMAEDAVSLANNAGQPQLGVEIGRRLILYLQQKPYVAPRQ
ncbi:MAG: tetratricopeptide repeat protein [Gemmatimonadota bacterium]